VLAAGHVATLVALVRAGGPAASQSDLGGEARRVCAHVPPGLHVQELHGFLLSCGSGAPAPAEPLESEGSAGEVRDGCGVAVSKPTTSSMPGSLGSAIEVSESVVTAHVTDIGHLLSWSATEPVTAFLRPAEGRQSVVAVVGFGVAGRARTGAAGFTTPGASGYTTATMTTGTTGLEPAASRLTSERSPC
jgi:hypothetical protein